MPSRRIRSVRPTLEHMEQRALLAGNVTVSVVAGDLVIRGDNAANAFDVVPGSAANSFVVRGRSDAKGVLTQINGTTEFVANGVTRDFKVTTLGGNDIVRLLGGNVVGLAAPRDVLIDGGAGNDSTEIRFTTVARNQKVLGGAGNDQLLIADSTVHGAMHFDGAAGNDSVTTTASHFEGAATFLMGSGNDIVRAGYLFGGLAGSTFHGACLVRLGAGNDQAESFGSNFHSTLSVLGEAGNDRVLVNQSSFSSNVTANGGPGTQDRVDADPNNGNHYAKLPSLTLFEVRVP